MQPLVVIPTYLSEPEDVGVVGTCLRSIRQTVSDTVSILVVDDCSPEPDLLAELEAVYNDVGFEVVHREENSGFSTTVNVGLQRALDEGRDAVLMNADMEMLTPGWVGRCQRTTDPAGERAAIVGALLYYPNGLIQHAGVYLSFLSRQLFHRYAYGPGNLPEALHKHACPVTGAFQYIRHSTLEKIGLFDEGYRMGFEDMEYCVRAIRNGLQPVYNPNIRAYHHESMFRGRKSEKLGRWQTESWLRFMDQHENVSLAGLVPDYY